MGKNSSFPFFYLKPKIQFLELAQKMPSKIRTIYKGEVEGTFLTARGEKISPPKDWSLLPPGDAALTRAVKKAGPYWKIEIKNGRRLYSGGIWAADSVIKKLNNELKAKRKSPDYLKKKDYNQKRRNQIQREYINAFQKAVLEYLSFHNKYQELALEVANAVTEHSTPIGSGTVARTKSLAVEKRAEAAVIAWLRHKTTDYDTMKIKRIKGERKKVRRILADMSTQLLDRYRRGEKIDSEKCPLNNALESL